MIRRRKRALQTQGCLMFVLLSCALFSPLSSAGHGQNHGANNDTSYSFSYDQDQGLNALGMIEVSGESHFQLRDAKWTLYDISITNEPLLQGDYLTAVFPMAEGYFWELSVNASGHECTCVLEISFPGPNEKLHVHPLIVYLGSTNHQPVLLPTNFEHNFREMVNDSSQGTGQASTMIQEDVQSDLELSPLDGRIVEFNLITPNGDLNGSMLKANICEAPYNVCLDEGKTITLESEFQGNIVSIQLNSSLVNDEEGIWKFSFFAQDNLLRTSFEEDMSFIFDITSPSLVINMDSSAGEHEPFTVFSEGIDGYTGAFIQENWKITLPNGSVRAPYPSELIDDSHLVFNFSQSGEYTLELTGRDKAGNMNTTSVQFNILNQNPVAVISIDGLTTTNEQIVQMNVGGNWSILATDSYDNEPIDYLWIISSSTSIRGVESLSFDNFKTAGTYSVELIVFDDDGSTNSTLIQLEIQAEDEAGSSGPNIGAVALVGLALFGVIFSIVYILFGRKDTVSLPKWSASNPVGSQPLESVDEGLNDATIEEASALG
jgi:hypothetical protein